MDYFKAPENPEYIEQIRKFKTSDPAHADLFNSVVEALVNNDEFIRFFAVQLGEKIQQHATDMQAAFDTYYQQSTGYTNNKISQLINGAPTTLDTLGEIADAMQDNADVVEVLEAAIGTKANQTEMESLLGTKLDKTGDVKDNTITYSSGDTSSPSSWAEIALFKTGEKISAFANKVSTMMKNMRYMYKMLGTTDISTISDGTITGAISALNTGMTRCEVIHGADIAIQTTYSATFSTTARILVIGASQDGMGVYGHDIVIPELYSQFGINAGYGNGDYSLQLLGYLRKTGVQINYNSVKGGAGKIHITVYGIL